MADMTPTALSDAMDKIDFAMLSTGTEAGALESRPVSNDGEAGSHGEGGVVPGNGACPAAGIRRDPQGGLTGTGATGLLPGEMLRSAATEEHAEPIEARSGPTNHWPKDLDRWFGSGIDTPGLILTRVHTDRIHDRNGAAQGEVPL